MASTDTSERKGHNPVHMLQTRLLLAATPSAQLEAYRAALPEIVAYRPAEAISFACNADKVATALRDWTGRAEILRLRAAAYIRLNQPVPALADLHEALSYLEEAEEKSGAVRTMLAIGEAYAAQGEPIKALREYQRALGIAPSGATSIHADVLEALADLYLSMGDYVKAIDALRQSHTIRTELEESDGVGRALCAIGTAFGKMGDLATAYDYHEQSLEAFRAAADTANEIRALANLASIHQHRGELNDALELAWRAYAACETGSDWATLASIRITIADLHLQQREPDRALQHYVDAYNILNEHPADELLLGLYLRIGRLHESLSDLDAAQHVYRVAIEIAERIGQRQMQAELHRAISGVFERKGYYREALGHYQQFARLQQELSGEEQRRLVAETQIKYDMMAVERELAEALNHARKLEEDMELTQQELMETQIGLTGANAKLEKMARMQSGREGNQTEGAVDQAKENEKQVEAEGEIDPAAIAEAEREWKNLQRQIERSHPGFFERLAEICPALTPTEIRICSLTKLGRDTNEIARLLHNTPRTVQTQRHKIRKKMGLDKRANFPTYISSL